MQQTSAITLLLRLHEPCEPAQQMQGPAGEPEEEPAAPPLRAVRVQAPIAWRHPEPKPHPPLDMEGAGLGPCPADTVQQLFEAALGGPRPLPEELRASSGSQGTASRWAPPPPACRRLCRPPAALLRPASPPLWPPSLLRCPCHREREEMRFKVAAGRSLDYQAVPWAGAVRPWVVCDGLVKLALERAQQSLRPQPARYPQARA